MPLTTPVTTGSIATANARSEPNASSSSPPINAVPKKLSSLTSRSICARLCTANTGAPLACRRRPCAAKGAKAVCTRSSMRA